MVNKGVVRGGIEAVKRVEEEEGGGGALRRCAPLISARGGGRWPRGGGNGGRGNSGNGEAMGAGKAAATAVQSMVHTVGCLCPDSEADKRA
jgi:hypothetical protein